jgi:hypothetical protein
MIFLRKRRSSKIATAATQPTAIPAIAPPERPLLEPLELEVEVEVEVEVVCEPALVFVAVWWFLVAAVSGNG